jgi:hypothetical protein
VLHASLMPFLTEDQCKVVVAANVLVWPTFKQVFSPFFRVFANFCAKTLTLTFWQSLGFPLQGVLREVDM